MFVSLSATRCPPCMQSIEFILSWKFGSIEEASVEGICTIEYYSLAECSKSNKHCVRPNLTLIQKKHPSLLLSFSPSLLLSLPLSLSLYIPSAQPRRIFRPHWQSTTRIMCPRIGVKRTFAINIISLSQFSIKYPTHMLECMLENGRLPSQFYPTISPPCKSHQLPKRSFPP